MADKTVLCVSLLFSLLVFHPLCGLQGVNASPTRQLNSLRSEYSEKTSLIQTRVSGAGKPLPAPLAKVEYGELLITVEIYESDNPINATLSVTHLDGWLVYSLSSVTTWFGGKGKVFFNDGGVGYDHWAIRWELPGLVSATTEIKVGIYREIPEDKAVAVEAERKPVEQIFKFHDSEVRVRASPDARNEINYSKQ